MEGQIQASASEVMSRGEILPAQWFSEIEIFYRERFGQRVMVFQPEKRSGYGYIYFLELENKEREVVKVVIPDQLSRLSVPEREKKIRHINDVTAYFRASLKNREVPIIEPYSCYRYNGWAFHVMPYLGESLDTAFAFTYVGCKRQKQILCQVLDSFSGVLAQGDKHQVGLDPRLTNFYLYQGRIVYGDYVPALCCYQGRIYLHEPNPQREEVVRKEFERKFLPFGMLRRLLFSLLQENCLYEDIFFYALEATLSVRFPALWRMLQASFNGLLYKKVKSYIEREDKNSVRDVIRSLNIIEHTDDTREIAAFLIKPDDKERGEKFEKVFFHSSTSTNVSVHSLDNHFQVCKDILLAEVENL